MSATSSLTDRRRLAPRTSEDEALFIAKKYAQNKLILEAKLANSLNGGRMVRQTMLDDVAAELSAKFNIAARSRKYVEQKLRDMKKEARKFFYLQQNAKPMSADQNANGKLASRSPPEPIRVMIEAMADELRAGSTNDDHEAFGKQFLRCEKLEIDVERDDFTSRQSAASTSGESATGAPSSEPADDDDNGSGGGNQTLLLNGHLDDGGTKAKFSSPFDSLNATSWSSMYGQSLTAALLMGLGGGCAGSENLSFPNKSLNPPDFDIFNAALRQFADNGNSDGGVSSSATGDASTAEFLKTLAASSLLLPNFYLPPTSGVEKTYGGTSASRKASFPSSHRSKTRDAKNTSNPCSPFSASVSSAGESPRIFTSAANQLESSEPKSPSNSLELRPKAQKSVTASTRTRRLFGGARLRHSAMRRLPVVLQNATTQNSEEPADIVTEQMTGRPLRSLKRRLLLEEINASKAFTTLCIEIQKSVDEAVKCFAETHRLHAQLLRAQLAGDAAPIAENGVTVKIAGSDERRARKRKNPTALLTPNADGSGGEFSPTKTAAGVFLRQTDR